MSTPSTFSTDPTVTTHPDGTQTYTPGMWRRKLLTVLLGAAITLFGVFWQLEPARLFLFGESTEAKVAYVLEVKPGQEPVKHDTRKAVSEAEDPTRNATFYYYMRFVTPKGDTVTAQLNYGQALRPIHSINDPLMIAYDPERPETIIDKWSVRTWAFGFFFMGTGLLILIPQWFLLRAANKPIVLDQILDYEDIAKKTSGAPGPGAPGDKPPSPAK
jgi:hypothetical protein